MLSSGPAPPNHCSEFQGQIPHKPSVSRRGEASLGKDEGGRISDTLLGRLQPDPARKDQE